MEIKHIMSFVAVAETHNMSIAAKRCSITQSAVSRHIKAIEEEIGNELFERKSKELVLTESGKILLKRARAIIKEEKELKEELSLLNGNLCGELHIGVGSFIAPYIRRTAVEFMKLYPDVIIHSQFDHARVLNNMLRNGEIDIAFTMNTAYHYEGIVSTPCIPFKLSAIMSKKNKLASKDVVTYDDLMKSKIIMPDVGERVFQTVQRYIPNNDLSKLPVSCIVSEASEALLVLEELDAITFLPSEYTDTSTRLVAKQIKSLDMELMSNAHWLKNTPLKASAKLFLNKLIEITKK